jgi:predicted signal transduction protein with EAL and GGDEF domain
VARIGGDEFIILMSDLKDSGRDASRLAQRIIASLQRPFDLAERQVMTQTSVGITLFPDDGDTTEDLIKNADMAMYKAKREGKNQYALFTDEMNKTLVRRVSLEADIRKALDREEIEIYYQPKVDIDTSFVSGAEALVRWRRAGTEMISPGEFIPLAEETGVIFELGTWVLSQACRQAQAWREMGYDDLSIAVNLSPKQFRDKKIRQLLQDVLEETGLAPELLTLEITENVMVYDVETTIATMGSIAGLGVHWSIDDFGTGYSSMAYLQRLPLNELKIDKSFIDGIPENAANSKIVESTLALAKGFDLKVVAEGVEKKEQVVFLAACHCNEIQGYLISKPVPPDAFLEFLNQTHEPFWMNDLLPGPLSDSKLLVESAKSHG